MIEPKPDLIPLDERPAVRVPRWIRLACALTRPVVDRWADKRGLQFDVSAGRLEDDIRRCETRGELERLLGPPRYCLAGHLFRLGDESPDLVECYTKGGYSVDILFRNGAVWEIVVGLAPTRWRIAMWLLKSGSGTCR